MKNGEYSGPAAAETVVDVLIMGSGTGLAAALAAHELGLSTLVVEKTALVGGSTARSGGAFWIPGNAALQPNEVRDSTENARIYLDAIVGDASSAARYAAFLENGPSAVAMLGRMTALKFFWARGYADYHPEQPGGSALGHTCESKPYDVNRLGVERNRFRPGVIESPLPVPATGADYRWLNLMKKQPGKGYAVLARRLAQGVGGLMIGRRYVSGGQALAAGMFEGVIRAAVPVWTRTRVVEIITDNARVTGAIVEQDGRRYRVLARRGVVLAAGGFDHNMPMRQRYQSPSLVDDVSLGAEGNTGDAIQLAHDLGAALSLMEESWWFPAVAPLGGGQPQIILAERSMPGCIIVDQHGQRFANESMDYMSFGQRVLQRERDGDPVREMWMIFDQENRDSYLLAAVVRAGQDLPKAWYEHGIAFKADDVADLAKRTGLPEAALEATMARFNAGAAQGRDPDFRRGESIYDRYYGDPTVVPNPNLRPLKGCLYAVKLVMSDLGTCGGIAADEHARVLRADGSVIPGLYAIGNCAANVFGRVYPGAGATIGQGVTFAYIAARHMAQVSTGQTSMPASRMLLRA